MKMQRVVMAFLFTFVVCGSFPPLAKAQSSSGTGTSSASASQSSTPSHAQPGQTYRKPTNGEKIRNYVFDSFGPYAILGSAIAAGINQASGDRINGTGSGTPPEWGGGTGPYFERFASNYGINIVSSRKTSAMR